MKTPFRVVTASSLFDGHDAAINVFRRLLLRDGCEVIHLGHNRSVSEIIKTAIEEDVDAVCVSSYQGGHMEFFKFMVDELKLNSASHIKIFGGGGGTILPQEIEELESYGVTKLYHAEDGRRLGLDGVVKDILSRCKKAPLNSLTSSSNKELSFIDLAKGISLIEQGNSEIIAEINQMDHDKTIPVVGITGPGGAGKSSFVDELIQRFSLVYPDKKVGVLAYDPTKRKTGGALLGDRIRMNAIYSKNIFVRSLATKGSWQEISASVKETLKLMQQAGFSLIFLETSGIGQGDSSVVDFSDFSIYVMTSEYGASSQLEKIDMLDFADMIVLNKFDKMGAEDSLEDVMHAYAHAKDVKYTQDVKDSFPIFGTIASSFNEQGVNKAFKHLMKKLNFLDVETHFPDHSAPLFTIIPKERTHYLSEISNIIETYKAETQKLKAIATKLYHLKELDSDQKQIDECEDLLGDQLELIKKYFFLVNEYQKDDLNYQVRQKTIKRKLISKSLSDLQISKIALPRYKDLGDVLEFMREENFPGYFPFASGVFPLRNEKEDPTRMFAGEGSPERTNKRFHYLSEHESAKRLSTAFDSVTLYGEDPSDVQDIYGKVGNSGVSIATLDHMKTLYQGFDLTSSKTSVSLTINGPAPAILAMFFNAAIDFEVQKETGQSRLSVNPYKYEEIKKNVLQKIRGTVQADILKEEQAQNTCIFSSAFALKMMGDVQEYFIQNEIHNFYSVSISGYHIAEAGANPIHQLAFTLANGFTIVEYYLSRGMHIDEIAPNLSFFFSCGMDPEYAVIGKVARRIWAIAMKLRYHASEKSQRLKYHIQTSGRSLHAQEIAFNDIRTTLQALIAYYDTCDSLHTNSYDEAITTPTEESVRRAMAIQMILSKEFGVAKCQNPMQGSFFHQELTELVEEAVLKEFEALSKRGGVLGAMEKQYQRHKIQTDSLHYERLKASGELPIIGVNTFLGIENAIDYKNMEVIRATDSEKRHQIETKNAFIQQAGDKNKEALNKLKHVALSGENIFAELMETVKYASLGQITHILYQSGGKYRRSM